LCSKIKKNKALANNREETSHKLLPKNVTLIAANPPHFSEEIKKGMASAMPFLFFASYPPRVLAKTQLVSWKGPSANRPEACNQQAQALW
jgi:hypothetical protein